MASTGIERPQFTPKLSAKREITGRGERVPRRLGARPGGRLVLMRVASPPSHALTAVARDDALEAVAEGMPRATRSASSTAVRSPSPSTQASMASVCSNIQRQ